MTKRATPPPFDYQAERAYYHETVTAIRPHAHLRPHLEAFGADFCRLFRGKAVLDFGGGEALHSKVVAEECAPRLVAVTDLFWHRIAYPAAQNRLAALRFVAGDCFRLPFRDGVFDVVFGSGILHHFRDLDAALGEVSRVLKRPGRYLGIEPNFASPLVRAVRRGIPESANEWDPAPQVLRRAFASRGYAVSVSFFWRRLRWLRWRLLTPTVAIDAALS